MLWWERCSNVLTDTGTTESKALWMTDRAQRTGRKLVWLSRHDNSSLLIFTGTISTLYPKRRPLHLLFQHPTFPRCPSKPGIRATLAPRLLSRCFQIILYSFEVCIELAWVHTGHPSILPLTDSKHCSSNQKKPPKEKNNSYPQLECDLRTYLEANLSSSLVYKLKTPTFPWEDTILKLVPTSHLSSFPPLQIQHSYITNGL